MSYGGYNINDLYDTDENGNILPFDEGPSVRISNVDVVNSSSIDTTAFDSYRQGVELTLNRYYQLGAVKIHSGEPDNGHRLVKNRFGMDKDTLYSRERFFREVDYFDSVSYLKAQSNTAYVDEYYRYMTYPVLSPDVDQSENYILDGVIEPLTIRAVASFFSIEAPFESHSVNGEIEDGNVDMTRASDGIQSQRQFDTASRIVPYLDLIDIVNGRPTPGYFEWTRAATTPFNDHHDHQGVWIEQETEHMRQQIEDMDPSTESYVPFDSVSSTCGFIFDTLAGTDSIAFGGLLNPQARDSYGTNYTE